MEVLTVRSGMVIEDGNYPPRLVLADVYGATATILRVNHPEEDIDTLIRQIPHIRRMNAEKSAKMLDNRKQKTDT